MSRYQVGTTWLIALGAMAAGCDRPPITAEDLAAARGGAPGGDEADGGEAAGDGDFAGCGDHDRPSAQARTTDDRVQALLASMTLADKVDQMAGFEAGAELFRTPDNERLGIRGFRFRDGPRGVRLEEGTATCFPVSMARGASFDVELEREVGAAMAREVRGLGHNLLLAPTINTLRHPAWGRAQETYGEDPLHLGLMGAAMTLGIQDEGVPACMKHLAGNNLEDTRMTNNAVIDEQNLRENYLRQFRIVLREADPACVMSAYNKVNGQYCSENNHLIRQVLKDEWGFDGFVVSDWFAARSTIESAIAGLDVEMPFRNHYARLESAVASGQVDEAVIDDAVRRILRVKFKYGMALLDQPWPGDPAVVESQAHIALAKEAAIAGAVLLDNADGALPFDRTSVGKIAVVGVWSDQARLGDNGSSKVVPSYAVTPFQGIAAVAGDDVQVVQSNDSSAAAGADVAVIIGALTAADEGEAIFGGGDREGLSLSEAQEALIREVSGMVDTTIVVLEAGGPITMANWRGDADAVVMAWYPGQEGGTAIGELLFGDANFSGRLPQTWPKQAGDEPEFGNTLAETEYAYLHGYRHFVGNDIEPLFPFGHGLSYTTFEYRGLALSCEQVTAAGRLTADVAVANTGDRPGAEVVQLYATFPDDGARRPPIQLAGFSKVELAAGEEATVTIPVWIEDLAYYDDVGGAWVVAPGAHRLHAGPSVAELPLSASFDVASEGRTATPGGGGPPDPPEPLGGPAMVTFQLDLAGFSPRRGAYLQGSFNDWCGLCQPMADEDGDGVYALTLPLDAGEHGYLFTTEGWAGLIDQPPAGCANDRGRRTVVVGDDDVQLPAHYMSGCAGDQGAPRAPQSVTFSVDLTGWPDPGGVSVRGAFNGWCGECDSLRDAGDSLFSGTIALPPGEHGYELVTHAGDGLVERPAGGCGARSVSVADAPAEIPAHRWGQCDPGAPPPTPVQVRFRATTDEPTFLQADFNGWCADCAPLDGDGSRVEALPAGQFEYRFATAAGPEALPAGCDLNPGDGRNGRVVTIGIEPVDTAVHTLGSCEP